MKEYDSFSPLLHCVTLRIALFLADKWFSFKKLNKIHKRNCYNTEFIEYFPPCFDDVGAICCALRSVRLGSEGWKKMLIVLLVTSMFALLYEALFLFLPFVTSFVQITADRRGKLFIVGWQADGENDCIYKPVLLYTRELDNVETNYVYF